MSNAYLNINCRPETCGWCNSTDEDENENNHDRPCRICDGQGMYW